MRLLDRARRLGLHVQDDRRQNGDRRIVVSSACGTFWSYWRLRRGTPLVVLKNMVRSLQTICTLVESGEVAIRRYDR